MLLFGKISSTAGNLKVLELPALYLFLLWVYIVCKTAFRDIGQYHRESLQFFRFFLGEV